MKMLSRSLLLAGLVVSGAARAAAPEDAAIRQVEATQEAAWNAHDAHAFMATFTPDAYIVNGEGHETNSRDEAERRLGFAFTTVFAGSNMHVDTMILRGLTPDLASAHVTWTLTGLNDGSGSIQQPLRVVQTQLLQRIGGSWLIMSAQSTAVIPEGYRPPPVMPQPAAATPAPPPGPPKPCLLANRSGTCLIEGHAKKPKGS